MPPLHAFTFETGDFLIRLNNNGILKFLLISGKSFFYLARYGITDWKHFFYQLLKIERKRIII